MFREIGVGRDEVISRADFRKLAEVAARPACALRPTSAATCRCSVADTNDGLASIQRSIRDPSDLRMYKLLYDG